MSPKVQLRVFTHPPVRVEIPDAGDVTQLLTAALAAVAYPMRRRNDANPHHPADLLSAVHHFIAPYLIAGRAHGPLPDVGSRAWTAAPEPVRLAAVLILAQAWVYTRTP